MLPEIQIQTYKDTLPVSKIEIKFRPYLIKEQKILLMAIESGNKDSITDAILQVLYNCLITKIDLMELPQVDVEYYFYMLRARSQSEIVNNQYKCNNQLEDGICGNTMEQDFNIITDIKIENLDVDCIVPITETVGIKFNYPKFTRESLEQNYKNLDITSIFNEVMKYIDYIYDENNTYRVDESNYEEVKEFLEKLSTEQFNKLDNFFGKLPTISKTSEIVCSKCGYVHTVDIEDIFDFF